MEPKVITAKEQKELDKLTARIAAIDMERAKLLKQIRENPVFAVQNIKEKIASIIGKYYDTPNKEVIYTIISGDVKLESSQRRIVGTTSFKTFKTFTVDLKIVKYDKTGQNYNSSYLLRSAELPKDVLSWLTMGNTELTKDKAKQYIIASLKEEKKKLEEEKKKIDERIKLLTSKL